MRDFQPKRVAGRKGVAHLRSKGRAFAAQIKSLFVATLGGFFAIFVDVLDQALENEQVWAALAGELDAIAVVPFDGTAKNLTIFENYGHRGMGLHLLDPIEVLGMRRFRPCALFAGDGAVLLRAGCGLLLGVRETPTQPAATHQYCTF